MRGAVYDMDHLLKFNPKQVHVVMPVGNERFNISGFTMHE